MKINERGFVTPWGREIDINGTHLVGTFSVSYKELKRIFGKETRDDMEKSDAMWLIETPNGPATIYDYKEGKNYNGSSGTPKTKITEWHIGGTNENTYAWVALAICVN